MASIEHAVRRFRIIFRFAGRRHTASLKTTDLKEADALAGSVERTLQLLEQGAIESARGGRPRPLCPFRRQAAEEDRGRHPPAPWATCVTATSRRTRIGAMEDNSLDTVGMHLGHFVATLGAAFPVQTLERSHLQQHVDRRAKEKGHYQRPLSPVTLRKEMASFAGLLELGRRGRPAERSFPEQGPCIPQGGREAALPDLGGDRAAGGAGRADRRAAEGPVGLPVPDPAPGGGVPSLRRGQRPPRLPPPDAGLRRPHRGAAGRTAGRTGR